MYIIIYIFLDICIYRYIYIYYNLCNNIISHHVQCINPASYLRHAIGAMNPGLGPLSLVLTSSGISTKYTFKYCTR